MALQTSSKTELTFQQDSTLTEHKTTVVAIHTFDSLDEANKQLFKSGSASTYALTTTSTIFHPQGGGQPSDTGTITTPSGTIFTVEAVRTDALHPEQVLHFGQFSTESPTPAPESCPPGSTVIQCIDAAKRLLYSRYHTAGHVLGAAVRHLLQDTIPGFDELKASHFPDAAACEFAGSIDGAHKPAIQAKVDEYVAAGLDVGIEWWDRERFQREGLLRLVPEGEMPGEGWRVVRIRGAECYPCGGTHVATTAECGETVVRKIARKAGVSRVSYALK